MPFENENTWFNARRLGRAEEFHSNYEKALETVRAKLGAHNPLHIGSQAVKTSGEFTDTSPTDTRMILGYFQRATAKDARDAISAAAAAFTPWSEMDYRQRSAIIRKAADIMSRRKFELAALTTLENGKNRYESIADVDEAIDFMRYYSHEIEANNGFRKEMGQAYPSERTSSTLRPYGVWTVIAPFNFPVAIATGMSVGALITGNTIVFKPASDTPLTGLRLYEILTEAGLPEGVMNYVTGSGGEIGSELVENPRVAGIVFTGSLEVGMSIYSSLSKGRAKPFIAEMGGKNPTIVTAKADVEAAVEGVALSAFGYGGQKCSACSRVYVQRELLADFTAKLVERTKQLTVGNPTLKENYMGPVINDRAYRNFQHYAEIAQTDGKVLTGGRVKSEGELRHGFYVEPTIVADLPVDHRFFKEELFLPILSVAPFDSFDEALKLANSVEYGLTAGIFTQDEGEMAQFFDRIEAGVAYANRKMGATTGAMVGAQPFVGWKLSGITGRGAGGPHYLPQFMREQSRTKVVT